MPGSDRVYPNIEPEDWRWVPKGLRPGLQRWFDQGIKPGSFLQAVLANDLTKAAFQADRTNFPQMGNVAKFIYWHAPPGSYGSWEALEAWSKQKGLEGATST